MGKNGSYKIRRYIVEKKIIKGVKEDEYQKFKKILNKSDDYFSNIELKSLMDFLMSKQ